jgi:hypothetical protein
LSLADRPRAFPFRVPSSANTDRTLLPAIAQQHITAAAAMIADATTRQIPKNTIESAMAIGFLLHFRSVRRQRRDYFEESGVAPSAERLFSSSDTRRSSERRMFAEKAPMTPANAYAVAADWRPAPFASEMTEIIAPQTSITNEVIVRHHSDTCVLVMSSLLLANAVLSCWGS